MRKLNRKILFLLGAPKAGTTTLWQYLQDCPEICMTTPKEPHYFSIDRNFEHGLDWYLNFFDYDDQTVILGDASTSYGNTIRYPNTVERIANYVDDPIFLYCIRHPMLRIESGWKQALSTELPVSWDFNASIWEFGPLLENSLYKRNIDAYIQKFGKSRIKIIIFEELIRNPTNVLSSISQFVGASPDKDMTIYLPHKNRSAGKMAKNNIALKLKDEKGISTKIYSSMPMCIKKKLSKFMRRKIPERPKWSLDTFNRVKDIVKPEADQLLSDCGLAQDYWSYDVSNFRVGS